jgi:hypothetical protein
LLFLAMRNCFPAGRQGNRKRSQKFRRKEAQPADSQLRLIDRPREGEGMRPIIPFNARQQSTFRRTHTRLAVCTAETPEDPDIGKRRADGWQPCSDILVLACGTTHWFRRSCDTTSDTWLLFCETAWCGNTVNN